MEKGVLVIRPAGGGAPLRETDPLLAGDSGASLVLEDRGQAVIVYRRKIVWTTATSKAA
jgi:hypothetical protein